MAKGPGTTRSVGSSSSSAANRVGAGSFLTANERSLWAEAGHRVFEREFMELVSDQLKADQDTFLKTHNDLVETYNTKLENGSYDNGNPNYPYFSPEAIALRDVDAKWNDWQEKHNGELYVLKKHGMITPIRYENSIVKKMKR